MEKSFEEKEISVEQEAERRIKEELLAEATEKGREVARQKINEIDEYAEASAERYVSAQEARDTAKKEYENLKNLAGKEKMHALNRILKYLNVSGVSSFDLGIDPMELQNIREQTKKELLL